MNIGHRLIKEPSSMEMTTETKLLETTRRYLTSITADILHTSDRKARIALGAGANVIVGATFASTVIGAVGALGSASTGTAIAGLAGAAKSSATLYWIGGLVGGGVAAGTVVVGVGTVGVGMWGAMKARKAVLGAMREKELGNVEQRVILAVGSLVAAIEETLQGPPPGQKETELFVRIGVLPLLEEIESGLASGAFSGMKVYRRVRLRGRVNNLSRIIEGRAHVD